MHRMFMQQRAEAKERKLQASSSMVGVQNTPPRSQTWLEFITGKWPVFEEKLGLQRPVSGPQSRVSGAPKLRFVSRLPQPKEKAARLAELEAEQQPCSQLMTEATNTQEWGQA